ncbi:MAG: ABC transporter ATP-binding protein [Solibacillus sp.]
MIDFQQVTKKYGQFTALDQLVLKIEEGTIFGLVGANGAGKSTTFLLLATLLQPTNGDILVNGKSVVRDAAAVRAQIGYMPDFFGVYDQLKTEEYLDFYGATYGLSSEVRAQKITELLALVRLSDKRDDYVDHLSRGMKQRLCLARSLMHDPQILILDEPASGLDPRARVEMRDILKDLKDSGKTILISSHILPELAEICDEIGVLHDGKLIAQGNIQAIQAQLQGDTFITVKVLAALEAAEAFFRTQPNVADVSVNTFDQTISFAYTGQDAEQAQLLKQAVLADIQVLSYEVQQRDLEDVFMAITKEVADA